MGPQPKDTADRAKFVKKSGESQTFSARQDATERAAAAALAKNLAAARERRAQAEVEYNLATENQYFTKDFNTALEAVMKDKLATAGERVLAYIKRYSWGEYSLYAIGDDGHPRFQVDCAKELGLNKKTVSRAVAYLQARGYIANEPKRLYPVLTPVLGGPTPNGKKSRAYETFLQNWKVSHSIDFERLEVARSTIKEIKKVLLSDYQKWRKSQTPAENGALTLLRSAEEGPKNPSRAVLSPLEASNRRHQQAPAEPPLEGEKQAEAHADASKLLFDQIEHMQKSFPDTPFSRPPIDRNDAGDQGLVNRILKEIGSTDEQDVIGFVLHCSAKFKGIGKGGAHVEPRIPGKSANAPKGVGLLVSWAMDYARIARPRPKGVAADD